MMTIPIFFQNDCCSCFMLEFRGKYINFMKIVFVFEIIAQRQLDVFFSTMTTLSLKSIWSGLFMFVEMMPTH